MKTKQELEKAWSALPESNTFRFTFTGPLSELSAAETELAELKQRLERARETVRTELAELNRRVVSAARKDWTETEVKEAGL